LLQGQIKNKLNSYRRWRRAKVWILYLQIGIGYKNIVPFYKRDQRK
jgi:hypothetical protein